MTNTDLADRARELYESMLRPKVERGNFGRYIVIDVESGDYEIGDEYLSPTRMLRARHPEGALHTLRIGYPTAGRIGGRVGPVRS